MNDSRGTIERDQAKSVGDGSGGMRGNVIDLQGSAINGIDFGSKTKALYAASALASGVIEGLDITQNTIVLFRDYVNGVISLAILVQKIKDKEYV